MAGKEKLPAYFKEYLDERFNHTNANIAEVRGEVTEIKKQFTKMNGGLTDTIIGLKSVEKQQVHSLETYTPLVETYGKAIAKNKSNIRKIAVTMVVGTVVWIKESRDWVINAVLALLGSF